MKSRKGWKNKVGYICSKWRLLRWNLIEFYHNKEKFKTNMACNEEELVETMIWTKKLIWPKRLIKSELNYVPRVLSCPTCLCFLYLPSLFDLRYVPSFFYVPYMPSFFTCLHFFTDYDFFTCLRCPHLFACVKMCLHLVACLTCLHLFTSLNVIIFYTPYVPSFLQVFPIFYVSYVSSPFQIKCGTPEKTDIFIN